MVSKENSSYSKRLLHLVSWGHWFTFFNIGAALLIALIFIDAEGIAPGFIGKLFMVSNWLAHMAFLTFICFVLTVFPLTLLYPKTRVIRGAASFIFTFLLTLLVIDGFTYSQLGYHLNFDSLAKIIDLVKEQMAYNSLSFTALAVMAFIAILMFELIMSNYAWKHMRELQQRKFPKVIVAILVGSFVTSHLIHVWADAELEYDVLRQDTVLPLSYPSTAKTLLTKYGLFNQDDYEQRKNSPFSIKSKIPAYPELEQQCLALEQPQQSIYIVLRDQDLSTRLLKKLNNYSSVKGSTFLNYVDNSSVQDAWFNLFYSLPNVYQTEMIDNNATPLLFQLAKKHQLTTSLTVISKSSDDNNGETNLETNDQQSISPQWVTNLVDHQAHHTDISKVIAEETLTTIPQGIHIVYLSGQSDYQYELFVNALLLAQQQLDNKDVIWLGSLGNKDNATAFNTKPALLIWPGKAGRKINGLANVMDIQTTLMRYYFECRTKYKYYSNGNNLYLLDEDRMVANITEQGLIVTKKDKNLLIDQQGNFSSYSIQLETVISEDSDFPMLIDGVNLINQFSINNAEDEEQEEEQQESSEL